MADDFASADMALYESADEDWQPAVGSREERRSQQLLEGALSNSSFSSAGGSREERRRATLDMQQERRMPAIRIRRSCWIRRLMELLDKRNPRGILDLRAEATHWGYTVSVLCGDVAAGGEY